MSFIGDTTQTRSWLTPPRPRLLSPQVDGQFVTPVRLSVLKSQYEQIMRTLNNLTVPAADDGDLDTETTQRGMARAFSVC